jgi:hypothetical protein
MIKMRSKGPAWGGVPATPPMQEVDVGRLQSKAGPRQKHKTFSGLKAKRVALA